MYCTVRRWGSRARWIRRDYEKSGDLVGRESAREGRNQSIFGFQSSTFYNNNQLEALILDYSLVIEETRDLHSPPPNSILPRTFASPDKEGGHGFEASYGEEVSLPTWYQSGKKDLIGNKRTKKGVQIGLERKRNGVPDASACPTHTSGSASHLKIASKLKRSLGCEPAHKPTCKPSTYVIFMGLCLVTVSYSLNHLPPSF
ncbi:hypothetical protein L2E82_17104 [Cichorium intybus]|uniref:Uncharacterized protein n=1 Tax=Cichorium intybus TaxID=13427 RepID=A0ACB9F801_CICIN|nr:hypothetical protein L2E82_17104 [Cichorium intybus]